MLKAVTMFWRWVSRRSFSASPKSPFTNAWFFSASA
jgi:hypothetical protein